MFGDKNVWLFIIIALETHWGLADMCINGNSEMLLMVTVCKVPTKALIPKNWMHFLMLTHPPCANLYRFFPQFETWNF